MKNLQFTIIGVRSQYHRCIIAIYRDARDMARDE